MCGWGEGVLLFYSPWVICGFLFTSIRQKWWGIPVILVSFIFSEMPPMSHVKLHKCKPLNVDMDNINKRLIGTHCPEQTVFSPDSPQLIMWTTGLYGQFSPAQCVHVKEPHRKVHGIVSWYSSIPYHPNLKTHTGRVPKWILWINL